MNDSMFIIHDDIGYEWTFDGERLYELSAEAEGVESNGYWCDSWEEAMDILVEDGYLTVSKTIIVEVHQGIVNAIYGLPKGMEFEVIDWDVLDSIDMDTLTRLYEEAYGHYPEDLEFGEIIRLIEKDWNRRIEEARDAAER